MGSVKTFVPMDINSNGLDELYPKYIEELKNAGVSRVFFCGVTASHSPKEVYEKSAERFGKFAKIFEDAGFEVAAWLGGTLGHGGSLVDKFDSEFTHPENVDGKVNNGAFCPLDDKYVANFQDYVKSLVKNGAKMIMLDDDFRMNLKAGDPFCFCEKHMKLMSEYLGREVSKEDFRDIFKGGPSEERKAYMYAQGEGLKHLARSLREAIDEVDPTVRLGHCAVLTTWDVEGVDSITLSKVFAGNTRPFIRLIGAAYWANLRGFGCKNLSAIVQYERMQEYWCRDEDVEIFAEGDVYPRPRYVVPSSYLELLDLSVRASGGFDGHLKYMSNYGAKFDYDKGYFARHNKNAENRDWIEKHFDGKKTLGLKLFEPIKTIEYSENINDFGARCVSPSLKFSAYNAVPSKFDGEGLTVIWGDSAWLATENELKNGAILDGVAADILTRRGFDVGVETVGGKFRPISEKFLGDIDDSTGLFGATAYAFNVSSSSKVLSTLADSVTNSNPGLISSVFEDGSFVGSYTYQNGKGQNFLVYSFDGRSISENVSFFDFTGISGNYRKKQLFEVLESFGCDFPVCKTDAPFLYILAKADENEMSVYLMNAYEDSVLAPEVEVGDEYVRVEVCNGSAELKDGKVTLSDIHPFGFTAFTVYKK